MTLPNVGTVKSFIYQVSAWSVSCDSHE